VTLLVFCCCVAVDAVMPVMIYFKEPPAPLSKNKKPAVPQIQKEWGTAGIKKARHVRAG